MSYRYASWVRSKIKNKVFDKNIEFASSGVGQKVRSKCAVFIPQVMACHGPSCDCRFSPYEGHGDTVRAQFFREALALQCQARLAHLAHWQYNAILKGKGGKPMATLYSMISSGILSWFRYCVSFGISWRHTMQTTPQPILCFTVFWQIHSRNIRDDIAACCSKQFLCNNFGVRNS